MDFETKLPPTVRALGDPRPPPEGTVARALNGRGTLPEKEEDGEV